MALGCPVALSSLVTGLALAPWEVPQVARRVIGPEPAASLWIMWGGSIRPRVTCQPRHMEREESMAR